MGWGINAALRKELIEKAGALVNNDDLKPSPDYIIVDLNTQVRLVTAGNAPTSPWQAATRIIERAFGKGNAQNAGVVIVADDKSKLPPIRAKVQNARLKRLTEEEQQQAVAKGKLVVGDRAFSPGTEPLSDEELDTLETSKDIRQLLQWERLLNSPRGKSIAFALLEKAIRFSAQSVVRGSKFKLLLWHTGETPYTYPKDWPHGLAKAITDNAYGEADERVTEAVAALQTFAGTQPLDIVIKTIDTDMLIQMLVADIKDAGSITIQFKNETVDALKWRQFYGATTNERASKALILTMASGCDYNAGLTQYGYLNKTIVNHAEKPIKRPFVTIDRQEDACSVDVVGFAKCVKQIHRRKKRKVPPQFREELENAAFTVAYFAGIKRKLGGPKIQNAAQLDAAELPSEFDAFVALRTQHTEAHRLTF